MVRLSTKQSLPKVQPATPVHFVFSPAYLDRLADAELQHGHIVAAKRLAHKAAEMREAGR